MKPIGWMAVAVTAGIAIGFLAGRKSAPALSDGGAEESSRTISGAAASRRDRPDRVASAGDELLTRFIGGRDIRSLTTAEVAEILRANIKPDPNEDPVVSSRRNYQLQLLLSKLPATMLEELSKEMLVDDAGRFMGGSMVFNAWARRDWEKALAWADSDPRASRWAGSALAALAATDSGLAAEKLNERMLSGDSSDRTSFSAVYSIGLAQARAGKDAFLTFLDTLPSNHQSNVISNSVAELPKEDLAAVVDELYARKKDGTLRDYSFNSVLTQLMRSDPDKAREWLDQLPDGEERSKLELSLAGNLASSGKTEEATAMMKRLMEQSPGKEKDFFLQAIGSYNYQGTGIFAELAKSLPPGVELKAEDFKNAQQNFIWGQNSALVEAAKVIRDPQEKVLLLTGALDKAAEQFASSGSSGRFNEMDFRIIESRITALGLTGQNAAAVQASLDKARTAATTRPAK